MRLKFAFLLLTFCVLMLSCTDKKPVSQAQGTSIEQKESTPVKRVDSVEVAKQKPLTYKILVPTAYRYCNPDTLINKNWVELYKDGKDYYVGKARYSIKIISDECGDGSAPKLSGKRNTILFVNQLPIRLGKVQAANIEISDTSYLVPGTTYSFTFLGKRYKLEAKAQGEDVFINYALLLNGERFFREVEAGGACFNFLFAGDLDGDSKLDLVLSAPTDYENLRIFMFLSSCAPPGLQIGKAAEIVDDFSC
ncbi:MAG: FG-GAP repeat protein [Prevotella fusca]|uniref:FG-GAP repeat protein n=1 Tax=Prevotella fusca TaxID=589436 RepID=UPI003F9F2A59